MDICSLLSARGALYGEADTARIRFDPIFREICASNSCGYYGACWTCPPDAGEIDALMLKVKSFTGAIVFTTTRPLEDSFDIEGMHEASRLHNQLVQEVQREAKAQFAQAWVLGAGTCGVCETCTKRENQPCRFPERAVTSLEACGVDVYQLAKLAGLKYINGANTVTYFGMLLYNP